MDPREIGWGVWSGFTWLRIGLVGVLLWMRWWTFGFWRHGVSYLLGLPKSARQFPPVSSRSWIVWIRVSQFRIPLDLGCLSAVFCTVLSAEHSHPEVARFPRLMSPTKHLKAS
jgi:hypothetical protein